MSTYAANEFVVSSNNSMNENVYNSQKASKSHKIKSILKPLLRMLRRSSAQKMSRASFDDLQSHCTECSDNSANEDLEYSIMEEIDRCHPNSAIFVADEDGNWQLSPVVRGACVPVHFARTEAGTFFWTSMRPDQDVSSAFHCYTECQQASQQQPIVAHDRWVQA